MKTQTMGPPTKAPAVRVIGRGVDLFIRVEDDNDAEIVRLALRMVDRRRYGITLCSKQWSS